MCFLRSYSVGAHKRDHAEALEDFIAIRRSDYA